MAGRSRSELHGVHRCRVLAVSATVRGITHFVFYGVGVADSTACGLILEEDDPKGEEETDCMACIAHSIQGPIINEITSFFRLEPMGRTKYVRGNYVGVLSLRRLDKP
jgi:hypothetical protein